MPAVNRKAPEKANHTQSVIFSKAAGYTKATASSWLKSHKRDENQKYYLDGYDETEGSHRFRQFDPDDKKFRYRNHVISKKSGKAAITLVLGFPKGSRPRR